MSRTVKWTPMADAMTTGVLVATMLDSNGEPTKRQATCDFKTFVDNWLALDERVRWLIVRGGKESADNASAGKGSRDARFAAIADGLANIADGNLPGMRSRLSDVIRGAARFFNVSDSEMIARWDTYTDEKQKQVADHPGVQKCVYDIRAERAAARKKELAESAKNAGELEF